MPRQNSSAAFESGGISSDRSESIPRRKISKLYEGEYFPTGREISPVIKTLTFTKGDINRPVEKYPLKVVNFRFNDRGFFPSGQIVSPVVSIQEKFIRSRINFVGGYNFFWQKLSPPSSSKRKWFIYANISAEQILIYELSISTDSGVAWQKKRRGPKRRRAQGAQTFSKGRWWFWEIFFGRDHNLTKISLKIKWRPFFLLSFLFFCLILCKEMGSNGGLGGPGMRRQGARTLRGDAQAPSCPHDATPLSTDRQNTI